MKKILCVVSRPPYQGSHDLELIEAAMVGAVFEMQVSVLFRGDGVWALHAGQNAAPLQQRTLSHVLSALPTYDVKRLYVCAEGMTERGLAQEDLCIDATPLSMAEQQALMSDQQAVLGAQT